VRVPTGAFVARRNGKIFVTGNSGFPKSLDISKALDKMAGAEREVVGFGTNGMGRMNQNNAKAGYRPNPYSDGIDGVPITTPSTDAAKQWAGWGSALKPAHEPVVLARKPLEESTIAANVLKWSTGAINIDACRIAGQEPHHNYGRTSGKGAFCGRSEEPFNTPANGRFPSNLIHDGSPEVMAEFAKAGTTKSGAMKKEVPAYEGESTTGFLRGRSGPSNQHGDSGSVARFFMACEFTPADYAPIVYYAKASRAEREEGLEGMPDTVTMRYHEKAQGPLPQQTPSKPVPQKNHHPTVKPISLMRYLCRLITPPGGLILDPFGGSGTTGLAATKEGFHYILIEKEPEYCEIARKRIAAMPARLDRWAEAGV